ncbi:MAG: class A beta-lactamase-related serine hydrolase [Variovorax sp.]|nr:MAG: class A beta-lactamase-related serine hydrolase [Variovorax sp.]
MSCTPPSCRSGSTLSSARSTWRARWCRVEISRTVTVTSRRRLILAGAALTCGSGCSAPRTGAPLLETTVPAAVAVEWDTAPPERQGIDAVALAGALRDGAQLSALRALVVVRNGTLVGERYYNGASAEDLLPVNSVTKSVCAMLVGQALQRGLLPGLDATVGQLLPEAAAQVPGSVVAGVTLRQILTGRSGLASDWDRQSAALANAPDPLPLVMALPADPAAAGVWRYNNAAVGLLSAILARAHGRDLAEVAARDLFGPLGITRYAWSRDRAGRPTAHAGLRLRTRDLARIAWTMADGGRWHGVQVVPSAWVADSMRPAGPAAWRVAPVSEVGYGYLWFTGLLRGRRVAWGWGYGAQYAVVVPELGLVVATAATAPRMEELPAQNNAVMALVARVVNATS